MPRVMEKWYRGNLHMHSVWSDGDDLPERIAARFKAAGYNFIAFTEHDRFQDGAPPDLSAHPGAVARWGAAAAARIRLRRLAEYRDEIEEPGRFLIMNGEEVTVRAGKRCHWVNVINAQAALGPVVDGEADSRAAVSRLPEKVGRSGPAWLASFNHPNYLWNATAEDLAGIEMLRFFEIHTALNSTFCYGDAQHPGAERIWDLALAQRLSHHGGQLLYGMATDDCHRYETADEGPCRAWIMVHR